MKNSKNFTMKTIAATLAALSMMSTMSMAVRAEDDDDILPQTDITAADSGQADGEVPADEKAETYTIIFDTAGGSDIAPITAEAGTAITPPADPVKAGCTFLGWNTDIPEKMPEKDMTIAAIWLNGTAYNSIEEGFSDKANVETVDSDGNKADGKDTSAADIFYSDIIDQKGREDIFGRNKLLFVNTRSGSLIDPLLAPEGPVTYDDIRNSIGNPVYSNDAIADKAQELGKKIAIEMADASIGAICEAFPGGKIIAVPFKKLFHSAADGEDPMKIMDRKLSQMDGKLDELNAKLVDLNQNINDNTDVLMRKIEDTAAKTEIKGYFQELSPAVLSVSTMVNAHETNPDLNNQQKIMNIANIAQTPEYKQMFASVVNIMGTMKGGSNVYSDFYETIYKNMAYKRMFSKEAYDDAMTVADDLTTQYAAAVALMGEVQIACQAVDIFSDKDIEALGENTKEQDYFKVCDPWLQLQFMKYTKEAGEICADGFSRFKAKYDNADFIRYGTTRKHFDMNVVSYVPESSSESSTTWGEMGDFIRSRNRPLTQDDIRELVSYVRKTYDDTSIIDFLRKMGVNEYCRYSYSSPAYLIFKDEEVEQIKVTGNEDLSWNYGRKEYREHTFAFAKAVDITDKDCREIAVPYKKCKQVKLFYNYGFFETERANKYYDFENIRNNYLVIY
ncbi:MAG: InlB B-repeat-containing protein [Oscillospiraceae bacterium]|nr:InlB B-repeat-containing protein [Oscillospiraceae bacterium]